MVDINKEFLPAYERAYYNIPSYIQNKYPGRSQGGAATRGAQVYQQNRINQIRSKNGITEAFDPTLSQGSADGSDAQHQLDRDLAVSNGVPISQAMDLRPGHDLANYRGSTRNNLGAGISAMDTTGDVNAQLAAAPGVLHQRYSNDAIRAGTLSDSAQSQHALQSDVNAGLVGAQESILHNNELLNLATQPGYDKNPDLRPQPVTSATAAKPLDTPPAQTGKPEDQPSDGSLVSGGGSNLNAMRMKQIQMKRAQ